MSLSVHVLDTTVGAPASGVAVRLDRSVHPPAPSTTAVTDSDGRVRELATTTPAGRYQIEFDTGRYFADRGVTAFFPSVTIPIEIREPASHYHVALLLSPYGYTTYRGS